jgi:hypothetical protein
MKRVLMCLGIAAALASCLQPKVVVTAEAPAIGARVFLDGKDIGALEERTFSDTTSKTVAAGTRYAYGSFSVPSGDHELRFVAPDGRVETRRVNARGELVLHVLAKAPGA